MSILSRVLLVLAAISLVISNFVPLWQIDLDAPQYPEGLGLKIHANKLAGDVDIINGLNHYIGMKTLHTEDFIEFTILIYIISFFALFSLITAIIGNKKVLYTLFTLFVFFGVVAMADFWRWEYEYGHDLDPTAAIIVPGMAYQPPLIGFKQLLNFGAYSIPDIGGWLFIGSGLLMLISILKETNVMSKFKKTKKIHASLFMLVIVVLTSCGNKEPQAIKLNSDNCDYCKMSISDPRFGCELITEKARVYKFDDVNCMMSFKAENAEKIKNADYFVSDFLSPNTLKAANILQFIEGEKVGSPMGGNIAAFANNDSATFYKDLLKCNSLNWADISR